MFLKWSKFHKLLISHMTIKSSLLHYKEEHAHQVSHEDIILLSLLLLLPGAGVGSMVGSDFLSAAAFIHSARGFFAIISEIFIKPAEAPIFTFLLVEGFHLLAFHHKINCFGKLVIN